jgi:hypothetical protein
MRCVHSSGAQADAFGGQTGKKGAAGFVYGQNIAQEDIDGLSFQYGLITAGLNNFDAITRKSAVDDDGRALLFF